MDSTSQSNQIGLNITVQSAGLLIHSNGKYLICHATCLDGSFSRTDGHWGVPKGIVEQGDSLLDTAYRETFEETSLNIRTLEAKKEIRVYSDILFKYRTTKKVVYVYYANALVDITSRNLKCLTRITGIDLPENDAFLWVGWDDARNMVSKRQKEIFTLENYQKTVDV